MLSLPDALRPELKDPLGAVYTDAEALLAEAGDPLVAVGDVVTYHLQQVGRRPDVAVVDERTERRAVSEELRTVLDGPERRVDVENAAATLSFELLEALREALDAPDPVIVHVDGEEDLAAIPAVVAAAPGASVVYGQPGEGMVHVVVTEETKARMREFLRRMDGDADAALSILER